MAKYTREALGPIFVKNMELARRLADKKRRPLLISNSHMRVNLCLIMAATRHVGW